MTKDQRISDYEEGQRAVLRVVEKQLMTNISLDTMSGRQAFLALADSIRDSLKELDRVRS
jgi:hypothetical protein